MITVTNPNAYSVRLTGLAITGTSGCTDPALTLVPGVLPVTIDHTTTPTRKVIAGILAMGAGATSDCQNADITLNLTPTVQR